MQAFDMSYIPYYRILILALLYLHCFYPLLSFGQNLQDHFEDTVSINVGGKVIYGSLITPQHEFSHSIVLIISGSGPTDRNGNNPMMVNNSLKMLAESLAGEGFASVRYDKRGVGASMPAIASESDLSFDVYVADAMGWIEMLEQDGRFKRIILLGHSEGSLIGMIVASKVKTHGFISIAGPGESADLVLKRQLDPQPEVVKSQLFPMIDSLKQGFIVKNVDPAYYALFRPSVQPYMISWFRYDPQLEISKLDIPVLIIQGVSDLQVRTKDAELLHKAAPKSSLKIIDGMNHILKASSTDRQENISTYSNPSLPINEELIRIIAEFIQQLE